MARYQYQRDGLGRLVQIIDPDNNSREIEYDSLGRVFRVNLPHEVSAPGNAATICYNGYDVPEEAYSTSGKYVDFDYDGLGRLLKTSSMMSKDGDVESQISYSYDNPERGRNSLGRLWQVIDDSGTTEMNYNQFGFVDRYDYYPSEKIRDLVGGKVSLQDQYSLFLDYKPTGLLNFARLEGINGSQFISYGVYEYIHDGLGRVSSVWDRSTPFLQKLAGSVAFDEQDRIINLQYGNKTVANWVYDPLAQWLTDIWYVDENGGPFTGLHYGYDANGNVETEWRGYTAFSEGSQNQHSTMKSHIFDPMDRLVNSTLNFGAEARLDELVGTIREEGYSYSSGGNILTAGEDTYQYEYPTNKQAASAIERGGGYKRDLIYNEDGQLVSDIVSSPELQESRTLNYDASGCLRAVEAKVEKLDELQAHSTTKYICGQGGNRVARLTENHQTGEVSRVIQFAGIAEIRPDEGQNGTMLVRLTLNNSSALEDAKDLKTGQRIEERSGYLLKDIRGSLVAKSAFRSSEDGVKLITREAEYGSWGETIEVSDLQAPVHQFVDHEPDPFLGYYQFGKRTYDPSLRRWLSSDPFFKGKPDLESNNGTQLNLYGYAENNPVNLIDKNGMYTGWVHKDMARGESAKVGGFSEHQLDAIERGAEWPDYPEGKSFFILPKNKTEVGSLAYRSHHGDLGFWHSMAIETTSAQDIVDKMLNQAVIWYSEALNEGKLESLGHLMHMAQDSYCKSHASRKDGVITMFQDYNIQSKVDHAFADFEGYDKDSSRAARDVTRDLASMFKARVSPDGVRDYLETNVFRITQDATVGGTDQAFSKDRARNDPIVIEGTLYAY